MKPLIINREILIEQNQPIDPDLIEYLETVNYQISN